MKDNPSRDYVYWTDCVNSVGELINEMRHSDKVRDITYETMLAHADDLLSWAKDHNFELRSTSGHGLTLKSDWSVSYHKSTYCDVPCYYLVWSGIEYVWIKKGHEAEVQACEERARAVAPPSISLLAQHRVERLPGGDAAGMSPADFDPVQLERGTRVEFEHTHDWATAQEITMDHLAKDPDYYHKLEIIDPHDNPDSPYKEAYEEIDAQHAKLRKELRRPGISDERKKDLSRRILSLAWLRKEAQKKHHSLTHEVLPLRDNPDDNPRQQHGHHHSFFDSVLVSDSSWWDPDELWGRPLTEDDPACDIARVSISSNPPPQWLPLVAFSQRRALEARAILESYGIKVSRNAKTLMCISMTRALSCLMTEWCRKFCYGKSKSFCMPETVNAVLENFNAFDFLATAPQNIVDDVAWAIMTLCLAFGIQNLRVPGIGDFTLGLVRVCVAMTEADPNFTIWGFTRKHKFALSEMPVLDNLVIWSSIDNSMSEERIIQGIDFATAHGTGLSFATEYGTYYKSRDFKNPQPPWWNPSKHYEQPMDEVDPVLDELLESGEDVSVVFGYHGRGKTTHVGGGCPECPATDPLGGGHFVAACQECYWCAEKPARRHHLDLVEHRLNTVAVIPIGKHQGTRVLLDTGERV